MVLDKSGHFPWIEAPKQFFAEVAQFTKLVWSFRGGSARRSKYSLIGTDLQAGRTSRGEGKAHYADKSDRDTHCLRPPRIPLFYSDSPIVIRRAPALGWIGSPEVE